MITSVGIPSIEMIVHLVSLRTALRLVLILQWVLSLAYGWSGSSTSRSRTQSPIDGRIMRRNSPAFVDEPSDSSDYAIYQAALERFGFHVKSSRDEEQSTVDAAAAVVYRWNAAAGMLQLVSTTVSSPKWIPLHHDKETVLITNGWSFLDIDQSEPLSSYDIDAVNHAYQPQWGREVQCPDSVQYSPLGFSLKLWTRHQVLEAVQSNVKASNAHGARVLLDGATDPPHVKRTNNGVDFTGADWAQYEGIFTCVASGLPLFATTDVLVAATVASGWLSLVRPLCTEHVTLVQPSKDGLDQRIEVVCATSGCHLGHYFEDTGYCINASALNFLAPRPYSALPPFVHKHGAVAVTRPTNGATITVPIALTTVEMAAPTSYRALEGAESTPSVQLLRRVVCSHASSDWVVLGAGCFWHVEAALRRLPGVISTCVGYAGGVTPSPTYTDVCHADTHHAEVVLVELDPSVVSRDVLLDCFLALHTPTRVGAHGKRDAQVGQYRSCIFIPDAKHGTEWESLARETLAKGQSQLRQELATQVRRMPLDTIWFWEAEEWHQRHDETSGRLASTDLGTLTLSSWLDEYGTRSASILGSAETMEAIELNRLMI